MTKVSEIGESNAKKLNLSDFEETLNPVERGIVKDWDGLEDLWRYVLYTGLGWEAGNEGQVLIAEALLTPKVLPASYSHAVAPTLHGPLTYYMDNFSPIAWRTE
jgi:actin-related protein